MEENKKVAILFGMALVAIVGIFGTYVHYTKQDVLISSDKNDKNKEVVEKTNSSNDVDSNAGGSENTSKDNCAEKKGDSTEKTEDKNVTEAENKKTKVDNNALPVNNDEEDKNSEEGKNSNISEDNKNKSEEKNDKEEVFKEYTVVKGDTLSHIWKENIVIYSFKNAKKIIVSKNGLKNEVLKPGQKLQIPFKESKGYTKYPVKKGDTLTRIAAKHLPKKQLNEAIASIIEANGKGNVESIEIDQVLLIPTK